VRLRELGAVFVDPANIPTAKQMESSQSELTVLHYEFKADLDAYLAELGPEAPVRTMADVIAFNQAHAAEEMSFFGQEHMLAAQEKGPLTEPAYLDALAENRRLARGEGIDAVLDAHQLDALVAPTGAPAWKIDIVDGDHHLGASSQPAALAGYPVVSVPAGHVQGLPVGISFLGRAFSEPTLIRLAYAFEQGTRARRPPTYRPTTP
jgi:amidase